jgi:hypothetical protein
MREIIEELPRLTVEELSAIEAQIAELKSTKHRSVADLSHTLLSFAGSCDGLPADSAAQHDHYLYGTPKGACSSRTPVTLSLC